MWFERLELEHDNMRAALSWAIKRGEGELGLRLAGALWRFWWAQGYFDEGRRRLEEVLAKGGRSDDADKGAGWSCLAGERTGRSGQGRGGRRRGAQADVEAGIEGSAAASLRGTLGDVRDQRGDTERAKELFEESVRLYGKAGDRWASPILGGLGNLFNDRGDYERAKELRGRSCPVPGSAPNCTALI